MVNAKLIAVTGVITITAIAVLASVYKSGGGSAAYNTVGEICEDVKDPSDEVQALCKDMKHIGVRESVYCGNPDFVGVGGVDDDAGLVAAARAESEDGEISCSGDAHYCALDVAVDVDPDVTPERVETFRRFCQKTCGTARPPPSMFFTMDEILSASDVNAKFDEVFKRCGQGDRRLEAIEEKIMARKSEQVLSNKKTNLREMIQEMETKSEKNVARRLLVDHGWCSTNLGFVVGASDDSSDYCNPDQKCDSYFGCSGDGVLKKLTECCVVHDKCLESDDSISDARLSVCKQQNCKGKTCDINLGNCAWHDKTCAYLKWGWLPAIDPQCVFLMGALKALMGGYKPQAEWNVGGDNDDDCCLAKNRNNMNCGGTNLDWGSHGQRPHNHNPHGHSPSSGRRRRRRGW